MHKKTGDIRFCLKARRSDFLFISLEVLKNPDCVRCAISLKATFALAYRGILIFSRVKSGSRTLLLWKGARKREREKYKEEGDNIKERERKRERERERERGRSKRSLNSRPS